MNNVHLSTKVSLINKYIQLNVMKDRGKSTHDDVLIKDILETIVEDLNSHEKSKSKAQQNSLQPIINELKSLKDENSRSRSKIYSFLEELKSLQETEEKPMADLNSIISNLEGMEASQAK